MCLIFLSFFYFNQFIYSWCTLGFLGLHVQRFAPRFVFLAFAHSFLPMYFSNISVDFFVQYELRVESWNISYSNFYNRKNVCFSCLFSFVFFLHWDCANSWYHIYMTIDFSLINLTLHLVILFPGLEWHFGLFTMVLKFSFTSQYAQMDGEVMVAIAIEHSVRITHGRMPITTVLIKILN